MRSIGGHAKKKPLITILGGVTLAGILIFVGWGQMPESFEHAGDNIFNAIESNDGNLLYRYLSEDEKKFTHATPATLTSFLRDFYSQRLSGYKRDGLPKIETAEMGTYYTQYYLHPDGRRNAIPLQLNRNGKGVLTDLVIMRLVETAFRAELPAGKPMPIQRDKLTFLYEAYSRNAERLSATGLKGVCGGRAGDLECWKWNEYLKRISDSIVRYDERQAKAAQEGTAP